VCSGRRRRRSCSASAPWIQFNFKQRVLRVLVRPSSLLLLMMIVVDVQIRCYCCDVLLLTYVASIFHAVVLCTVHIVSVRCYQQDQVNSLQFE
jgi:hypothetical protein